MPTLLALWLLAAAPSEADGSFNRARALMKAENYVEACPLFEKSLTHEPALGTLLNLAFCLEKAGKTASAFIRYNEAEAWATRTKERVRLEVAVERSKALKGQLAFVAVVMSQPREGTTARVAGTQLALGPGAHSVPVDPGPVEVAVEAPGHQRWTTTVTAPSAGTTLMVQVPALALLVKEPVPVVTLVPPAQTAPPVQPRSSNLAPGIGLGVSAVALVAGAVMLGWSLNCANEIRQDQLRAQPIITEQQYNTLLWLYPLSYVALGVGAVGAVVSSYFLGRTRVSVVPTGPSSAALRVVF